jgi:T-complex protein 1 subunit eta
MPTTQVVPRLIAQNAGFDSTDILNKLRQKHAAGGKYFGVDIVNDGICDTHETFVWEPSNIKQNAIVSNSADFFAAPTVDLSTGR